MLGVCRARHGYMHVGNGLSGDRHWPSRPRELSPSFVASRHKSLLSGARMGSEARIDSRKDLVLKIGGATECIPTLMRILTANAEIVD